jgi:endonuclease/exonuclease/phosphatase family metal-dependent hydrolase
MRSAWMRSAWLALCAGIMSASCTDRTAPVGDSELRAGPAAATSSTKVTVLTLNMYPGTNLDLVVAALASPDQTDDEPALALAIQTLLETDYAARAELLADEIAWVRPHAVGLQEVSTFDIAAQVAGQAIQIDFLPILEAALAARGLNYVKAGVGTNYTLNPIAGVSYSQGDALLVDADRVTVTDAAHHIFTYNIGVIAPGIELRQGWSAADAVVAGRRVIFVTTHPEANLGGTSLSTLRAAQVTELVGSLPVGVSAIVMGDLNDEPGSAMYQVLTGAEFVDVWRALRPGVPGYTCCHEDDLSDPVARFDEHIDYIFARGFDRGAPGLQGKISLFGDQPSERVAGPTHPLWPSDHAGLTATLLTPPAAGHSQ